MCLFSEFIMGEQCGEHCMIYPGLIRNLKEGKKFPSIFVMQVTVKSYKT